MRSILPILVINYDLGWGSITSSTSQLDYNAELDTDFSQLFLSAYYSDAKLRRKILFKNYD